MLLLDKDTVGHGHRTHLLGLDAFHSKHTDIGIGIANNQKSKFKSYASILVANH